MVVRGNSLQARDIASLVHPYTNLKVHQTEGPVVIGKGAQIGANAVVVRDVPAGAVVVGIPGKARMPGGQALPESPAPLPAPGEDAIDPAIWI